MAVKRREVKSKGEKERYKHLNAEFQRIARKDKKAFLSDQSKEIEENNRMGKTRDLFKIIRNTKGTFHPKMGSIKDRNGRDLTEADYIKKRWHEYTEELYKKIFMTQIIMMMLIKCCNQYARKFGKLSSGHRIGKGKFSFQSQEEQCQIVFKLLRNCTHFT